LIDEMLDVLKTPNKPQYDPADAFPLVLYDCFFENVSFTLPEP